jgi:hypothetical protein
VAGDTRCPGLRGSNKGVSVVHLLARTRPATVGNLGGVGDIHAPDVDSTNSRTAPRRKSIPRGLASAKSPGRRVACASVPGNYGPGAGANPDGVVAVTLGAAMPAGVSAAAVAKAGLMS